jgi:hypothetical protein
MLQLAVNLLSLVLEKVHVALAQALLHSQFVMVFLQFHLSVYLI